MQRKKGYTLLELMVALSIFTILSTLIVGAYATVSRTRAMTGNIRESQQKARVAIETISRLSRRAEKVLIRNAIGGGESTSGKVLELYYNIDEPDKYAVRFVMSEDPATITMEECNGDCLLSPNWGTPADLFGGEIILKTSAPFGFEKKSPVMPASLNIFFTGAIEGVPDNPIYSNEITLQTTVTLEAEK